MCFNRGFLHRESCAKQAVAFSDIFLALSASRSCFRRRLPSSRSCSVEALGPIGSGYDAYLSRHLANVVKATATELAATDLDQRSRRARFPASRLKSSLIRFWVMFPLGTNFLLPEVLSFRRCLPVLGCLVREIISHVQQCIARG